MSLENIQISQKQQSIISNTSENQNLQELFKSSDHKFETAKTLSQYNKVSLVNQVSELQTSMNKLQQQMVEFYFFLVGSRLSKTVNVEKERERYMNLSPMLLFDYMKSYYFNVQNEVEELQIRITQSPESDKIKDLLQLSKENDNYFHESRKSMDKVKFENKRLKQELEVTINKLNEVKKSKKNAIDQCQVIILVSIEFRHDILQQIQKENEKLLNTILLKNKEIEQMNNNDMEKETTILKLKDQIVEISKLQQKVKLLENKYANDINQVKVQSSVEFQEQLKKDHHYAQLLAQNQEKDDKIEFMENQIRSLRAKLTVDKRIMKHLQSSSQVQKNIYKQDFNNKQLSKAENEIARLKIRIEEKEKQMAKLKKEYDQMFLEYKQYKQQFENTNNTRMMKSASTGNMMCLNQESNGIEQNPYVIQEYQRRLREQDILFKQFYQLGNMKNKFKKMTLIERKGYVKQKEFEMQKYEYEKHIQELMKKVQNKNKQQYQDTDSSLDERGYQDSFRIEKQKRHLSPLSYKSKDHYTHRQTRSNVDDYKINDISVKTSKKEKKEQMNDIRDKLKTNDNQFLERIQNQIQQNKNHMKLSNNFVKKKYA